MILKHRRELELAEKNKGKKKTIKKNILEDLSKGMIRGESLISLA